MSSPPGEDYGNPSALMWTWDQYAQRTINQAPAQPALPPPPAPAPLPTTIQPLTTTAEWQSEPFRSALRSPVRLPGALAPSGRPAETDRQSGQNSDLPLSPLSSEEDLFDDDTEDEEYEPPPAHGDLGIDPGANLRLRDESMPSPQYPGAATGSATYLSQPPDTFNFPSERHSEPERDTGGDSVKNEEVGYPGAAADSPNYQCQSQESISKSDCNSEDKGQEAESDCCGCNGDLSKCGCLPGQCKCIGCGAEGDDGSAPMDISKTPLTPSIPRTGQIPGLGRLFQQPADADRSDRAAEQASTYQDNIEAQRATGSTRRERVVASTDRVSRNPVESIIQRAAEEGRVDAYHPTHPRSPNRAARSARSSVSSPLVSARTTPLGESIRRPDTPRPFDTSIRQSVEPEGSPPNWNHQSSPGYDDRSLSPSPTSSLGDVQMRDSAPNLTRESLVPPVFGMTRPQPSGHSVHQQAPAPHTLDPTLGQWPRRNLARPAEQPNITFSGYPTAGYDPRNPTLGLQRSPPRLLPPSVYQPPLQPSVSRQSLRGQSPSPPPQPASQTGMAPHFPIPAPPIPFDSDSDSDTPSLQPSKTRKPGNNSSSSRPNAVVADSGISKPKSRATSRKVTNKKASAPKEKTEEQKKKEASKVAAAVAKLEEKERKEKEKKEAREKEDAEKKQKDGTSVRRSKRIKAEKDKESMDP